MPDWYRFERNGSLGHFQAPEAPPWLESNSWSDSIDKARAMRRGELLLELDEAREAVNDCLATLETFDGGANVEDTEAPAQVSLDALELGRMKSEITSFVILYESKWRDAIQLKAAGNEQWASDVPLWLVDVYRAFNEAIGRKEVES